MEVRTEVKGHPFLLTLHFREIGEIAIRVWKEGYR
jgi:hypothetical protein